MRKRKKKTSADLVAHFQLRCEKRLGTILRQRDLKTLMSEAKLCLLGKQSNTRTLFLLRRGLYKGLDQDVVLAYDKPRHAFVTCMRYDAWKANHDENGCRTDLAPNGTEIGIDDPPIWA